MKDTDDMESIIAQFRTGNFILLHDDESRENEVDMILAGNFATPSNIQIMRELGGGLLCVAIPNEIGLILDLPYMWQLLDSANDSYSSLSNIINTDVSVNNRSTHSITFNQRKLGSVTDLGKSNTIISLTKLCNNWSTNNNLKNIFYSTFESPGHLQLLIGTKGLIKSRQGHTELSLFLTNLAELTPVVIMCEMLDGRTFDSLNVEDCKKIAEQNKFIFLESETLIKYYHNQKI